MESVQTGFRVAVGATASFIEFLQDPKKQPENLNPWDSDWNELTKHWAEKGEITEREARNFVDNMWDRSGDSGSNSDSMHRPTEVTEPSATTPPSDPEVPSELHELTQQIASLRAELEKLQEEKGDG
jgi:polyhydroxyalkanoate synthesis regulator phasin